MTSTPFILDIPAEEYHDASKRGSYLSSHMLADFRKCPELYRKRLAGETAETESTAFTLGRAAHKLILEGRAAFDEEYIVADGPINPKTGESFGRTTKAFAEWAAGQEREVIDGKDFGFLVKLQTAVWLHPAASEMLTTGVAEGTVRAEYCGEPCQIRMDFFNGKHGILDLKTCDDLTWFESDAKRYGYLYQLAFYRAVLREQSGFKAGVHIIAVEKREPFRCGVWRVSDEALNFAEMENAAAIERLRSCRNSGVWPTGYEEIRIIDNI